LILSLSMLASTTNAWAGGADRGVDLSVVYDGEGLANARGGQSRGAVYLGALHVPVAVDGERLLGWPGSMLFVNGLVTHGGHPSGVVGDAQGVSNLEAPAGWQIYEAWFQQNLYENRLSLLVGRYDINTEFYRLQSASLFLNSSFGVGPEFAQSGQAGPSIFPDPALGARLAVKPTPNTVVRTALLDGVPIDRRGRPGDPGETRGAFRQGDGLLLVGEGALLTRPVSGGLPAGGTRFRIGRGPAYRPYDGKIAVGGWWYTAAFDDLSEQDPEGNPVRHRGSAGAYVLGDVLVYRSAVHPGRELRIFAQAGLGDARVNRFGSYVGGGVTLTGLWPALENDELGVAVAQARNGSHFLELERRQAIPANGAETTIELCDLLQVGKHLAIQPDVQVVVHPGTDPTRRDAIVLSLRFEASY
jgi:porin